MSTHTKPDHQTFSIHLLLLVFVAVAGILALVLMLLVGNSAQAATGVNSVRPAAKTASVSVSLGVSGKTYRGVVNGRSALRLSGIVKAGKALKHVKVAVYRKTVEQSGGKWVKVGSPKVKVHGKSGKYSLTVKKPKVGYQQYRAVASAAGLKRHTSKTKVVRTAYCPTLDRSYFKKKPIRANFNVTSKSSPLTAAMIRGICGAKPKTTMRMVMWMIKATDGSEKKGLTDVPRILAAIDYVQAVRGVHTTVVYDDVQAGMKKTTLTYKWLHGMHNVRLKKCYGACASTINKHGDEINHEKVFQITSTYYKTPGYSKGGAPLVMIPSDNLSSRQLHAYRQDMLTVVGDKKLSHNIGLRVNFMVGCANSKGGKTCKNGAYVASGTRAWKHGHQYVTDASKVESKGSQGTAIAFSPFPQGVDPMMARLSAYTCQPGHRTIRIAMFQVQAPFVTQLQSLVKTLQSRDCDVRVKVSNVASGMFGSPTSLLKAWPTSVPKLQCANMIHNKFIYANAIYQGKAERTVIAGARNLNYAAAWINDEDMLRITGTSTSPANKTYRYAIKSATSAYLNMWNKIKTTSKCSLSTQLQ